MPKAISSGNVNFVVSGIHEDAYGAYIQRLTETQAWQDRQSFIASKGFINIVVTDNPADIPAGMRTRMWNSVYNNSNEISGVTNDPKGSSTAYILLNDAVGTGQDGYVRDTAAALAHEVWHVGEVNSASHPDWWVNSLKPASEQMGISTDQALSRPSTFNHTDDPIPALNTNQPQTSGLPLKKDDPSTSESDILDGVTSFDDGNRDHIVEYDQFGNITDSVQYAYKYDPNQDLQNLESEEFSGSGNFDSQNTKVYIDAGSSGNFSGSGNSIDIAQNVNFNISGSGGVINLIQNSNDLIGLFGQNQILTSNIGNNTVNIGGDGTTATVYGGGYVGLINNGQTLTLGDAGSSVLTAPNLNGETISATSASITFAAGTTGNVLGQNDTVTLQSNTGSSVGVQGTGMVVNGDGGNDLVNLAGDGTTATVNGGGLVGLTGDHETVRVGLDQRETIEVAPGVSHDTIYADNSEIDLPAGWAGSIYGEGLSIHMTPDSGSQINLYGYDDTISGREGNSVIADAYDPADPSDPYAPYQEGDPELGEPYDPEDPDPTDPYDPGDPWDEERVSTASTTQENKASSASASPELTGHQQLVSAMASFGATSQGDTIHPATAHQQTPDLAADASVARHKIAA